MGIVIEFQEVRVRGLALDLAQFLKAPVKNSYEAVEYARVVLEKLRDRGRSPETEYLALQYADLFLILLGEESGPGISPDPDSPGDGSECGGRQFG